MGHVQADQGAAGQQKGQQVAQVELVVDGRGKQQQKCGGQQQARPAGQHIDLVLRECDRIGRQQAGVPPLPPAQARGFHGLSF
ncbi:MAG: hypothetical protein EB007_07550 [Betaproteobacteria bacterium]|nr:hypothetical protein [Betaproteobacteria bacterium]